MSVRPITPDDFPAVAAFLADDETQLFGRLSRVGVADITAWLSGSNLPQDTWLLEEDGTPVAVGWVEKHEDTGVAIGIVHRDRRGRGLGSELMERSEERLRTVGVGRVHAVTLAPDVAAEPLLTDRGYRKVRRFWGMTIEFGEDEPPDPELPVGFRIERFSAELAPAFHSALEEAFSEHWEFQPTRSRGGGNGRSRSRITIRRSGS